MSEIPFPAPNFPPSRRRVDVTNGNDRMDSIEAVLEKYRIAECERRVTASKDDDPQPRSGYLIKGKSPGTGLQPVQHSLKGCATNRVTGPEILERRRIVHDRDYTRVVAERKHPPVPEFRSEDEERDFWAAHDSTEFIDWQSAQRRNFPT